MILVVGATGLVGQETCRRLAQRGDNVRALVRPTSSPEKVSALTSYGAELSLGDLKDPESLSHACRGVTAIVSTASSTLSRQHGDSIESVDAAGQLNLVSAAKSAGVDRFIFVSFRPPETPFPLSQVKQEVERALAPLNYTIVQASWFMEVWLSPALGFDYQNATVRLYGDGRNPVSWVSFTDVAEMCAVAVRHPATFRKTIEFGGPEALTPLQVVDIFERVSGRKFNVEHISEAALRAQYEAASNSLEKSFAGLMLQYAKGDEIDMRSVIDTYGLRLTTVEQYARRVAAQSAAVV